MDKKERLEQELKFLQESLEAEIITKEEYDKGKEKIEARKEDLENKAEKGSEPKKTPAKEDKEPSHEIDRKEVEIEERTELDEESELAEEKGTPSVTEILEEADKVHGETQHELTPETEKQDKEKSSKEEDKGEAKSIDKPKITVEKEIKDEIKIVQEPKKESKVEVVDTDPKEEESEKADKPHSIFGAKPSQQLPKLPKKVLWAIGGVLLIILIFINIPQSENSTGIDGDTTVSESLPICEKDFDCKEPGKVGICENPGTADASCTFQEPVSVLLTIVNDEDCKSCETSRMISSFKQIFPGLQVKNLEFKETEAQQLITNNNIISLPSYLFTDKVEDAYHFADIERALTKTKNGYTLNPSAAGASLYFQREDKPKKLELYVFSESEAEKKAENNVGPVLELLGDDIEFNRILLTQGANDNQAQQLGITSSPTFVINNRFKFTGAHSPNTIKEKFCEFNVLEACSEELSNALI